jgi:hypothetical protein
MGRGGGRVAAFPPRSGATPTASSPRAPQSPPVWRLAHKAADAQPHKYIPLGPQRSTLAATLRGAAQRHDGFTEFEFGQGPKFVGKSFATGPKSPFDRGFSRPRHVEEGPEVRTKPGTRLTQREWVTE